MRLLAVILLTLNAGIFAWQQGWLFERGDPAADAVGETFRQAPQALVLLSEMPPAQRQLMDQISASEERVLNARQQLGDAEDAVADVRGAQLPVESDYSDNEADNATEFSEAADPQLGAAVTPWCGEAGHFADEAAARAYIAGLEKLGAKGSIESRRERVSSVWWVHLGAFPSEAEARRKLVELQAKGIDSFYMADGQLAGGISLGVFSGQDRAQAAQSQLAGRGYAASIAEVDRLGVRVYVALELPDSQLLASPEWDAFQASVQVPELTEKLCEVIAPVNVFP